MKKQPRTNEIDEHRTFEVVRAFANEMKAHLDAEFNADGIQRLEEFIERIRFSSEEIEEIDYLRFGSGAFLGQCLVEMFGGKWWDGYDSVMIDDRIQIFVFSQVAKQFTSGLNDSVFYKFTVVRQMLEMRQKPTPTKAEDPTL